MRSAIWAGATCLVLASACDEDSAAENAARAVPANRAQAVNEEIAAAKAQIEEAKGNAPEGEVDACAFLGAEVVAKTLSVPDGVEVKARPGTVAKTLCVYTWPNPDYDPQAHSKAMMERLRKGMKKGGAAGGIMEAARGHLRADHEVNFTHGKIFESVDQAKRAFEANLERMKKGITRKLETSAAKGSTITFQRSYAPVEGVGDAAAWAEKDDQLAVLDGTRIFYLDVHVSGDPAENLDAAKKLAKAIIEAN